MVAYAFLRCQSSNCVNIARRAGIIRNLNTRFTFVSGLANFHTWTYHTGIGCAPSNSGEGPDPSQSPEEQQKQENQTQPKYTRIKRRRAMPKRTIESFFAPVVKRPAQETPQAKPLLQTVPDVQQQQDQQQPLGAACQGRQQPADSADVVLADQAAPQQPATAPHISTPLLPGSSGIASGAAAVQCEPSSAVLGAAGDAAGAAPGADAPLLTPLQQRQQMRSAANRNLALARQAVIKASQEGAVVRLSDLLLEDSWRRALSPEFTKPYFSTLQSFVQGEWARHPGKIYPPPEMVFRAFNSCPFDKVRVVILGQDPYHGEGQAMGLSFSVPVGVQVPSSLQNMYKELRSDLNCVVPKHGNLEKWSHQGVLLLNAVLTVRAATAASHGKKGWEALTDAAISALSQQRRGVIFMLWGRYAQDKEKLISTSRGHVVLTAAHPSGLSANRGFFGCKHFSKANEVLVAGGQEPIDWQIEAAA